MAEIYTVIDHVKTTIYRKRRNTARRRKGFRFPKVMNSISDNPSSNHRESQTSQQLNFDKSEEKIGENSCLMYKYI